jgi:branched-chain amino acid transport system ATP-binding protein
MTALLDVRHLSVTFGGLRAVDDVSLSVPAGTIVGLIGPNGAGKTTTIDALCGFVHADEGVVSLAGERIDAQPPHVRARAGLVRTFQSVELFDDLTVRDNLLVVATPARWWSPLADAVNPRRSSRSVNVDDILVRVGLDGFGDALTTELSNGQRRLVGVARALAMRPKVLLLDEPAAGLDPTETAAFGALLRTLPEPDLGVLLVEHDMHLVLEVCDELTVLDLGRAIASGPTQAVRHDPAVIEAYLGDLS